MSKTNKELAVEVWTAILQATATLASSPDFTYVGIPTPEQAVKEISELAVLLSQIEDN